MNSKKRGWLFLIVVCVIGFINARDFYSFLIGFCICALNQYGYLKELKNPSTKLFLALACFIKAVILLNLGLSLFSFKINQYYNNFGRKYIYRCQDCDGKDVSLDRLIGAPLIVLLADISPFFQYILESGPLPFLGILLSF